MKAVGYLTPGALDRADALLDIELEKPSATGHDLLVRVDAISVNPVDFKIRQSQGPAEGQTHKVLGWDAVGEVVATGSEVTRFAVGDAVWYAGDLTRQGTNAEFHLVDERIVGKKPASVSNAEAAALPLTSLTAYEMLFDRLRVKDPVPGAAKAIVIIGGAGGVGSITIQLLRALTDLTVIATASRPETKTWAKDLGAHHVINHREPLTPQVEALGLGAPGFVFSTTHTGSYVGQIAEFIAPQGRFGLIDDPESLDVMPFKLKCISTHWELMFTRSIFGTEDMARQGEILTEVSGLIDAGHVRSTVADTMGAISASNLRRAHELLESGTSRGKIVLEGFA